MRLILSLLLFLGLVGTSGAQSAPYRLKSGDTIAISVWQDSKLDRQLVVGPDGLISFPLVGQVRVGGQTLAAVESALRRGLQPNYTEPLDITVALAGFETRSVPAVFYVTGEVNNPGQYPLDRPVDALQAIAMSGGFSPFAATKRIIIHRQIGGEDVQFLFNYRDLIAGRDASRNVRLRPGDVVVVPEKGLFGQ